MSSNTESPFGTTPLPVVSSGSPVHVSIDLDALYNPDHLRTLQVPQVSPIAAFDATQLPGQSIDVNRHFLLYAVKNGLIRVLHKSGAPLKHLLRGHSGQQLRDIKFFQDGDILATVGCDPTHSKLLVWRVLERSPEIKADVLLELSSTQMEMMGMNWHPFNPNLFVLQHRNAKGLVVASLVETTRIKTVPSSSPAPGSSQSHAICQLYSPFVIMDGALQLADDTEHLTDLRWSDQETKHVLTSFETRIVLWDVVIQPPSPTSTRDDGTKLAVKLASIDVTRVPALSAIGASVLSRCFFVPYDDAAPARGGANIGGSGGSGTPPLTSCFVTGHDNNSKLVLWGPIRAANSGTNTAAADVIQVVELESSSTTTNNNSKSKYLVDGCFAPAGHGGSPPPGFLVVADTNRPRLLALHCLSQWGTSSSTGNEGVEEVPVLAGCDYVVPFANKEPIYSMKCVTVTGPDMISDNDGNVDKPGSAALDEDEGGGAGGGVTFDIQLYAYQAKNTQRLTLTSYMCLPPEHTYVEPTAGVRVQRLYNVASAHVSEIGDDDDVDIDLVDEVVVDPKASELQYDEEYEVEEDGDDMVNGTEDDDLDGGPEPSDLPPPQGFVSATSAPPKAAAATSSNPFANWLGAIAAKTSGVPVAPPPPPVPVPPLPVPPPPLPSQPTGPIKSDTLSEVSTGSSTPPLFTSLPVPPPPPPPPDLGSIPRAEASDSPPHVPPPPVTPTFLSPLDILGLNKPGAAPVESVASAAATSSSAPKAAKAPSKTPPRSNSASKPKAGPSQAGTSKDSAAPVAVLSRSTAESGAPTTPTHEPSIRAVVQEEIEAVLVPALQKALQAAVLMSVTPLQASVDRLIKMQEEAARTAAAEAASRSQVPASVSVDPDALMEAVEVPLKACVADHVKTVWIPALDSIASQVVGQVSTHLEDFRREQASARGHEMDAVSTQLSTMTALVTKLTSEVQGLRTAVAAQQQQAAANAAAAAASSAAAGAAPSAPAIGAPPVPRGPDPAASADAVRAQILALLRESKYEAAFTKAVTTGAGDNSMAVFCCLSANVQAVLGGPQPALSQPILLCLLQQLGTSLLNLSKRDVSLELLWLQEIALSLNPRDSQIHPHVPGVLQQLVAGINARMGADDPALRRPLQRLLQVVRGMQMG